MRLLAGLALMLATPFLSAGAVGAEPVQLAAHRATYNLSLDNSRGGDVEAVNGNMAYEVTDACDGWAVRQRLDMTLSNRDGQGRADGLGLRDLGKQGRDEVALPHEADDRYRRDRTGRGRCERGTRRWRWGDSLYHARG